MGDGEHELDARTESESKSHEPADDRTSLSITIVYHPEHRRIGQFVAVDPAREGRLDVCRSAPIFSGHDLPAAPLEDIGVSRTASSLRFQRDGSLTIFPGPRCFLENVLSSPTTVAPDTLARGFKLRLGKSVLLWIQLVPATDDEDGDGSTIVGQSAAARLLRREIRRVAHHDVPVLILGESGTGKELVAESLHAASTRRDGPLIRVNMAAIPPAMAAASLFGHARGAFTGAHAAQPGFFETADGGTLFMDEIADTPLEVQNALLRALALGEVQRVGDPQTRRVDVRLVAATDADLRARVAAGHMRLPLLMRLGGYEIRVPALRERGEDVAILLMHFLRELLREQGAEARLDRSQNEGHAWLPRTLFDALCDHRWPGNVRELRNLAQRLVVSHGDKTHIVDAEHFVRIARRPCVGARDATPSSPPPSTPPSVRRRLEDISESEVRAALEDNDHQPGRAAAALGVSRTSFYSLLSRFPKMRKASDLTLAEVREALSVHEGNVNGAAEALAVSARALRLRMAALDIEAVKTS